jgi:Poly(ADP-ribose) polymerase catalytic domain
MSVALPTMHVPSSVVAPKWDPSRGAANNFTASLHDVPGPGVMAPDSSASWPVDRISPHQHLHGIPNTEHSCVLDSRVVSNLKRDDDLASQMTSVIAKLFSEEEVSRHLVRCGLNVHKVEPFSADTKVARRWLDTCEDLMASNDVKELRVYRRFHGTQVANHDGIKRHGLVVPGSLGGVTVRNGSALGNGIYLAEQASTSAGYCHGVTNEGVLLVCAVTSSPELVSDRCMLHNGSVSVAFRRELVFPALAVHFSRCNTPAVFNNTATRSVPQRACQAVARLSLFCLGIGVLWLLWGWLAGTEAASDQCLADSNTTDVYHLQ